MWEAAIKSTEAVIIFWRSALLSSDMVIWHVNICSLWVFFIYLVQSSHAAIVIDVRWHLCTTHSLYQDSMLIWNSANSLYIIMYLIIACMYKTPSPIYNVFIGSSSNISTGIPLFCFELGNWKALIILKINDEVQEAKGFNW